MSGVFLCLIYDEPRLVPEDQNGVHKSTRRGRGIWWLELSCDELPQGCERVLRLLEPYLESQLGSEENLVFDLGALGRRDGAIDIEPKVGPEAFIDGVNHLTLRFSE